MNWWYFSTGALLGGLWALVGAATTQVVFYALGLPLPRFWIRTLYTLFWPLLAGVVLWRLFRVKT